MHNYNSNGSFFRTNRLVFQGGAEKPRGGQSIEEIDAILNGGPSSKPKDPVDAAREAAQRQIDKRQQEGNELARKNAVENAGKEIYRNIKRLETDRASLDRVANASKNPIARRNAIGFLLQTADAIGGRGTGANRIQVPEVPIGGEMSAMVSAVVENYLYSAFKISDVTDEEQFNNNIPATLERASRTGETPQDGRQAVTDYSNKMARLVNTVSRMKAEYSA